MLNGLTRFAVYHNTHSLNAQYAVDSLCVASSCTCVFIRRYTHYNSLQYSFALNDDIEAISESRVTERGTERGK